MGDSSGTIGWALDIDDRHLANMTLSVAAWVVESEAEYEEAQTDRGHAPTSSGTSSTWAIRPRARRRWTFQHRMTATTWKFTWFTKSCLWSLKTQCRKTRQRRKARHACCRSCRRSWLRGWHWRSPKVAETAELSVGRAVALDAGAGVSMVKVQLPAEVGRPRRGYHVNVVPPSGGCAAHPLAVLHVAEQS